MRAVRLAVDVFAVFGAAVAAGLLILWASLTWKETR